MNKPNITRADEDKLGSLILAVKEERLSREMLEQYYAELTSLYAVTCLEMSDLEKAEAMYIDRTDAASQTAKRSMWRATPNGQLLIQRKNEVKVIEKLLQSVKHRIFNVL